MKHHPFFFAVSAAMLAAASTVPVTVWAQAGDKRDTSLEYAQITGSDERLTLTRVPVTRPDGRLAYWDLTIDLKVNDQGKPQIGKLSGVVSPNLITGRFAAGLYKTADGYVLELSSAGSAGAGRTAWSLANHVASGNTLVFNGSWITGPIAGHPDEVQLTGCGVPDIGRSYGFSGQVHGNAYPAFFNRDFDILAAVQSGSSVILYGYNDESDTCGADVPATTVLQRCTDCTGTP